MSLEIQRNPKKIHVFQGAAGTPTSEWGRRYGFPTRLLALACKAGALRDPGDGAVGSRLDSSRLLVRLGPKGSWRWCYGFPTRLLALACEVGALKDPGGSEYFLRTVKNLGLFDC